MTATTTANRDIDIDKARASANTDPDVNEAATIASRPGTNIGRSQRLTARPDIRVDNVAGAPAQTDID
ncbi:hypothetical protein VW29_09040 [Devosia limi DSM 17137]|uniref:Uncharacterized protein n=1 Tax=Devosia limi DSM 17137 TaxID=1121477 RepID=A0A0F5LRH7_9HYPH|nr:hypothetical protein VW29_09040 [Devosia limi DSM 17137]